MKDINLTTPLKIQKHMTSHNVTARKAPTNFNATMLTDKDEERKNSGSNKAAGKTTLKVSKINMNVESGFDTGNKSIITKLKPWKEFFDEEEFKTGLLAMKETKKVEQEIDASSSDSEPSVDNFNQQELKENLNAALNLKEGENNPLDTELSQEEEKEEPEISNGVVKQSSVIDTEFAEKNEGINGPITEKARKYSVHETKKILPQKSKIQMHSGGIN